MKRARPGLAASGLVLLALGLGLGGCTVSTELLPRLDGGTDAPTRHRYPFCPTAIDVYGGANILLNGCGGPTQPSLNPPDGLFAPGDSFYDATLAGRLQASLAGDPSLTPIFGSGWQVRSCASTRGTLMQLSPSLPLDACGFDAPVATGQMQAMCTNNPAPVILLSADNLDDRCHGGGLDSGEADDLAGYVDHFARRLDVFLDVRAPGVALVGPQTEWIPLPMPPGGTPGGPSGPDPNACRWLRSDWNVDGLAYWAAHLGIVNALVLPDLHALYKTHHPCCSTLGVTCDTSWYGGGGIPSGLSSICLNWDGAQAMVDLWAKNLKEFLLANDFTCPSPT